MDDPTPFTKRINFATCAAWLLSSALMGGIALLGPGQDFRGYYAAARVVLARGNPYDYQTLAPVLLAITGTLGNNPYYYAPWLAWFMIPFAWLPYEVARAVWMILNVVVWDFSLWHLGKLFNWPKVEWQKWLFYFLLNIVFAWFTWRCEQVGILLLGVLVAGVLAFRKKTWGWVGVWLALFLIKPSITLIPTLAILLWLIRRRIWQPVISTFAITVGLLAVASLVTPSWYTPLVKPGFTEGLFNRIDGPGRVMGPRLHTTLSDWLMMLQLPSNLTSAISILSIMIGIILLVVVTWKSESLLQVIVMSLLVSFAVTPYAFQYDYPLLALVFIWALALSVQLGRRWAAVAGAVALFVVTVPLWERPISDGYWMVIGLIALATWAWYKAGRSQIPPTLA